MDCAVCREVLSAALDHEAGPDEMAAATEHLARCHECNAHRLRLDTLHRRVRLHPGEQVPDRTAAILSALPRPRRAHVRRAWLASAAVVAVAAGVFLVASSRDEPLRLSASPNVEVSQVAVSQGPPGGLSVVSFRVHNLSVQDDALVGVRTAAAGDATLHAIRSVDGREIMQSVDEIAVGAGETRDLGDGTSHIMLVDLREQLAPGVHVRIELDFVHAAPVDIDGVVTA